MNFYYIFNIYLFYICFNCVFSENSDSDSWRSVNKAFTGNLLFNYNITEGDILVKASNHFLSTVAEETYLWTNGIIPFAFDKKAEKFYGIILAAMKHIQANSCIRFKPHTNEKDFIYIIEDYSCFSMVGRIKGMQLLSFNQTCIKYNVAVHELMHTIGFYHTHMRPDRDKYIRIHWANIKKESLDQFKIMHENIALFTEFDFDSIMLYGPSQATKSNGLPTISSKIPGKEVPEFDKKTGLSELDIISLNKLYRCNKNDD